MLSSFYKEQHWLPFPFWVRIRYWSVITLSMTVKGFTSISRTVSSKVNLRSVVEGRPQLSSQVEARLAGTWEKAFSAVAPYSCGILFPREICLAASLHASRTVALNLGASRRSWTTIPISTDHWLCCWGLMRIVVHEHLARDRLGTTTLEGMQRQSSNFLLISVFNALCY